MPADADPAIRWPCRSPARPERPSPRTHTRRPHPCRRRPAIRRVRRSPAGQKRSCRPGQRARYPCRRSRAGGRTVTERLPAEPPVRHSLEPHRSPHHLGDDPYTADPCHRRQWPGEQPGGPSPRWRCGTHAPRATTPSRSSRELVAHRHRRTHPRRSRLAFGASWSFSSSVFNGTPYGGFATNPDQRGISHCCGKRDLPVEGGRGTFATSRSS
jgi:hypothetical protein